MGQYWTRKGDQEDKDERTVCPWTEHVGHGDRFVPDPDQDKEYIHVGERCLLRTFNFRRY